MTRLIDADDMIKSLMDMTFYDEEGHIIDDYEDRLAIVKSFVDPVQTVDAVPVSYIQQRIDRLRLLAEYEMEANGGYVGKVHTEVYALRALINYWKGDQSAKDK